MPNSGMAGSCVLLPRHMIIITRPEYLAHKHTLHNIVLGKF